MMNERTPSWPRNLTRLRWAFVLASVVCLVQAIAVFRAYSHYTQPDFGVYYAAVILSLTAAACVVGWTKTPRSFVLLALGSQLINGFVTGYYVLVGVTALVDVGWVALPHVLPGMLWDLVVLAFAATVVAHLTRRYVSIRVSRDP
jgi:hypothetical protein